ncbi:hypothetical protein ACFU7X_32245 [Streptomyces chartreusis]|uniref:hypothetical protein n=1 Tax=Streptomyces chartreusis TaxID=1969 RepID=UPI0036901847
MRTVLFEPRGVMSDGGLGAEYIGEPKWWSLPDVRGYRVPDLFSPPSCLAGPLGTLITSGALKRPVPLGL